MSRNLLGAAIALTACTTVAVVTGACLVLAINELRKEQR